MQCPCSIYVIACLPGLMLLAACEPGPTPTPALPTPTSTLITTITTATSTVVPASPTPEATQTPSPTTTDTAIATPTRTAARASSTPLAPTETSAPAISTVIPTTVKVSATSTPGLGAAPQFETLAHGFGSPDDIAVAPNGDILFGDFDNGALNVLRVGETKPVALSTGFNEPEGIVITQDGAIIVAEQGTNRIIEVDPTTGSKKMLRQLENKTGKDGVDGLGLDPATGDVLIPDSPNGRLLRMSRDGSSLHVIATGFVRPTGVAVEPGGSILVADEFGNAVYRLRADGTRSRLARIYQPDDVVVGSDGSIYVNSLRGDISRIDPATGQIRVLLSGLKLPHGLALDPQGNLVIAEAGRNRIIRLKIED